MNDVPQNEETIGPALPPPKDEEVLQGEEKPFEVVNGFPMYQEEHLIKDRCIIFERIGWNDAVGATYLALAPNQKELVLRLASDEVDTPKHEAKFLCKAEQDNHWSYFSQVHSIFHHDNYMFLALYYRGGPTLEQCIDFTGKKFSHGSGGRLAEDILQMLRIMHSMDWAARSLSLDAFHFDASSRHLFMADVSDLRQFKQMGNSFPISWVGGPLFAPRAFHKDSHDFCGISLRDEVEAWFYMFVYLVHGLPWESDSLEDLAASKLSGEKFNALLKELPEQYQAIYDIINNKEGNLTEDCNKILSLVQEIYHKVGGIADHEDNFDFEREPNEEELPRFVLERDDAPSADEEHNVVEKQGLRL